MDVIHQSLSQQTLQSTIEDLPDEVLEFILGLLPPYKDLQNCMVVCKRWYNCAQSKLKLLYMHTLTMNLCYLLKRNPILFQMSYIKLQSN